VKLYRLLKNDELNELKEHSNYTSTDPFSRNFVELLPLHGSTEESKIQKFLGNLHKTIKKDEKVNSEKASRKYAELIDDLGKKYRLYKTALGVLDKFKKTIEGEIYLVQEGQLPTFYLENGVMNHEIRRRVELGDSARGFSSSLNFIKDYMKPKSEENLSNYSVICVDIPENRIITNLDEIKTTKNGDFVYNGYPLHETVVSFEDVSSYYKNHTLFKGEKEFAVLADLDASYSWFSDDVQVYDARDFLSP